MPTERPGSVYLRSRRGLCWRSTTGWRAPGAPPAVKKRPLSLRSRPRLAVTTTFFAPPRAVHGRRLVLPPDEARHATRVLRHRPGDEIAVVDGEGRRHRVRLDRTGQDKTVGTILATEENAGEPAYHLTVGLGLLKKRSRFETFLEKAVELGAARILPLRTRYAEKEGLKQKRARRIVRAALKQSGRSRLPQLAAPTGFTEAVEELRAGAYDRAFIAHCREKPSAVPFTEALAEASLPRRILVLVGPEGGFSEEEVKTAEAAGATVVSLGPRRLRAETAALAAAAAVMLTIDGDL